MMRTRMRIVAVKCIAMVVLMVSVLGLYTGNDVIGEESGHLIMGDTNVSIGQMINYYQANNTYPEYYQGTDAPTIYDFCAIYMQECNIEGVKTEVAFAQAMKETGFLRFNGRVPITAKNFAGLGAEDRDPKAWAEFPTVREGIRAQIQHLKAYASTDALRQPNVDPRFSLVLRGCAPYVEWLGQKENPAGKGWATSPGYGYSILNDYMAPLQSASSFTTWYQGVDYSAVYNPIYYLEHYADIRNAFSANGDGLIAHFVTNGMAEGRQGCAGFNVQSYKNEYPDLRKAFGRDLSSYYRHYLNCGRYEGRKGTGCENRLVGPTTVYQGVDYSSVYNYEYYTGKNADVKNAYGLDDEAVIAHFAMYGMSEGRQACATFNVRSYQNQYPDLRDAYGNNLKSYYMHYVNYGRREGRSGIGYENKRNATTVYQGVDYSTIYNYAYYVNTNADVKQAFGSDDRAVLQHFVEYGMSEGRQACATFNVKSYQNQYADLRDAYGNNLKSYYMHYVNYGRREGRSGIGYENKRNATTVYQGVDYSTIYNYAYYVNTNADVKQAFGSDDRAVLQHFVEYGMSEGRQACAEFNVTGYRNRYQDLQNAYGNDLRQYYIHYINYGKKEGRNAG